MLASPLRRLDPVPKIISFSHSASLISNCSERD
jgi:hypothetical protein